MPRAEVVVEKKPLFWKHTLDSNANLPGQEGYQPEEDETYQIFPGDPYLNGFPAVISHDQDPNGSVRITVFDSLIEKTEEEIPPETYRKLEYGNTTVIVDHRSDKKPLK